MGRAGGQVSDDFGRCPGYEMIKPDRAGEVKDLGRCAPARFYRARGRDVGTVHDEGDRLIHLVNLSAWMVT